MAQPKMPPPNQPLLDVIRQSGLTIAELNQMLQDGAKEIERLIPKLLEKHTTGGTVKAAQLRLVSRELHVVQASLWGDLGRVLRAGVVEATLLAAESAAAFLKAFLARQGMVIPELDAIMAQQARAGIDAILAKAKNGIPLSRAVYKTQALTRGMVDRKVSQGLLLGHNARTIAKSVKDMIRPNVKGGVSYAAHRLARTEINHAYQTSQARRYEDEPWTPGMQWNLSRSHPAKDVCDVNATQDLFGLGPGGYTFGEKPDSHPNCLCYQTPVQIGEDEFVDRFLTGEYDDYLDDKLYTYDLRDL